MILAQTTSGLSSIQGRYRQSSGYHLKLKGMKEVVKTASLTDWVKSRSGLGVRLMQVVQVAASPTRPKCTPNHATHGILYCVLPARA